MMSSWGSTLVLNLRAVGVGQQDAGWISFTAVIVGNVGGLVVGAVADRFRNHRAIILVALFGSAACLAWFTLVVAGVLPAAADSGAPALYQVGAAATGAGLLLNSVIPIFYELAVEATYPAVPEATTIMVLTTLNNFGGLLLLFVPIASAAGAFNIIITLTILLSGVSVAVFFRDDAARWKVDADANLTSAAGDGEFAQALLTEKAAGQ
jgi:FLVCR family MFS transporter